MGILLGSLLLGTILLAVLIMIIWVVAIGTSLELTGALSLTAFFGIFLTPMGYVIWWSANTERRTATAHMRDWEEIR